MPRREQLPVVVLGVAAAAVAALLIQLVWNVRRAASPAAGVVAPEPLARAPSPPPTPQAAEPARDPSIRPEPTDARPSPASGEGVAPASAGDAAASDPSSEAIAFYDRGEYEDAAARALVVLAKSPKNIRMLRIVVSSSCLIGEIDRAKAYYVQLPPRDQKDVAKRCADKAGVQF